MKRLCEEVDILVSCRTPAHLTLYTRKSKKRNIVWFNPSFSKHVKTNISKVFLHLLEKHFRPHHCLHKICNKNNIKVSYSCMPNMAAIISRHNKAFLPQRTEPANTVPPCNCRAKTSCLMKGLCCESYIIYKATLTSDGIAKNYYGCSETNLKLASTTIIRALNVGKSVMPLSCLKLFGKPKTSLNGASQPTPQPYYLGARWCNFSLADKLFILGADPNTMLNKRLKLNGKCHHKNKFKLKNLL